MLLLQPLRFKMSHDCRCNVLHKSYFDTRNAIPGLVVNNGEGANDQTSGTKEWNDNAGLHEWRPRNGLRTAESVISQHIAHQQVFSVAFYNAREQIHCYRGRAFIPSPSCLALPKLVCRLENIVAPQGQRSGSFCDEVLVFPRYQAYEGASRTQSKGSKLRKSSEGGVT